MRRILFAGAIAAGLPGLASAAETAAPGNLPELRTRALTLLNQDRGRHDLPPLRLCHATNEAAQKHAEDMRRQHYFAHVSPSGETPMDRYVAAGGSRWRLVEENIAECTGCQGPPTDETVAKFEQDWMHSPEHRANILAHGLECFGYGIAVGTDRIYADQTFAGPGTPRGLAPGETATALPPEDQAAVALQRINEARHDAGVRPLEPSEDLNAAAQNLIAGSSPEDFSLQGSGNLLDAVPADSRGEWRAIAVLAGRCGGCGTEPTAADIRFFVGQWLGKAQDRDTLLSARDTHLGFVIRADRKGAKIALAVLGAHR